VSQLAHELKDIILEISNRGRELSGLARSNGKPCPPESPDAGQSSGGETPAVNEQPEPEPGAGVEGPPQSAGEETPSVESPPSDSDSNKGHGNDADGVDEDNPGKGEALGRLEGPQGPKAQPDESADDSQEVPAVSPEEEPPVVAAPESEPADEVDEVADDDAPECDEVASPDDTAEVESVSDQEETAPEVAAPSSEETEEPESAAVDSNKGHGNDADGVDEGNPGKGGALGRLEGPQGPKVQPDESADGSQEVPGVSPEEQPSVAAVPESEPADEGEEVADGDAPEAAAPSSGETEVPESAADDRDRGHGNDAGGIDADNPGQSRHVGWDQSPGLQRLLESLRESRPEEVESWLDDGLLRVLQHLRRDIRDA